MESTPQIPMEANDDSGLASFEASGLYVSTPVVPGKDVKAGSAPAVSRKRKIDRLYGNADGGRKNESGAESSPLLPRFSSTMNESLLDNLQKCKLGGGARDLDEDYSEPTTPLKQVKYGEATPSKTSSPYKEAQKILYPELKSRRATPAKFSAGFASSTSPKKQLFFEPVCLDPVRYFRGTFVMSHVFSYLSDGDLYRAGKVSSSWLAVVAGDKKSGARYRDFVERYRKNKENYRNTPPDSPPSPESPPSSPDSRVFNLFTKCAKKLSPGQSLRKCPICQHPSIVEKDVSQCLSRCCNYIYCLLCLSFSKTGPEDFHDKCQHSQLIVEKQRRSARRFCLADLSNSGCGDDVISFTTDGSQQNKSSWLDSSGFYSEPEQRHVAALKVRRNLGKSLKKESGGGVLSAHNQNVTPLRRKVQYAAVAPVVVCGSNFKEKKLDGGGDFSPPRLHTPVTSKQSKKNLKRLLL